MSTEFKTKTFDVVVTNISSKKPLVKLLTDPREVDKDRERALRVLVGIAGETEPEVLPFSADYALNQKSRAYRFDWIFGVALPSDEQLWWNWQKKLRRDASVAVQILISVGDSGFGFTEISTSLLALHPSRDSRSWLEKNKENVGKSLLGASQTAKDIVNAVEPAGALGTGLGAIIRGSSVLSSFVASRNGPFSKNWFIYRFLDGEEKCCAVEWRINKRVLFEYGPLLRGSLVLTFHGQASSGGKSREAFKLIMRPGLGYHKWDKISYIRPTLVFEPDERPTLCLKPRLANQKATVASGKG